MNLYQFSFEDRRDTDKDYQYSEKSIIANDLSEAVNKLKTDTNLMSVRITKLDLE